MKLKGKKKLRSVVAEVVKEFGLEGAIFDEREWEYDRLTDKIKFTPFKDWTDKVFNEFVEIEFGLVNPDFFIISLLHEIGHYMTDDQFDTLDDLYFWGEKTDNLEKLNRATTEEEKKALEFVYFRLGDEYAATEWAVDFYKEHPQWVAETTKKVNKALHKFYKKNRFAEGV